MYNYTSRTSLHQRVIHERCFTTLDGHDNAMSNVSFTWTSSNENVGTIDDTGLFEAITSGTATISAAYGSITGTTRVTVVDGGEGKGDSSGGSSAKVTPTPSPTATLTAHAVTKTSRFVPVRNAGEEVAMVFESVDVSLLTLKADTTVNEGTPTPDADKRLLPRFDLLFAVREALFVIYTVKRKEKK